MRHAAQWGIVWVLSAGLAYSGCRAEESAAERIAGLKAAADACRTLIQSQTAEIAKIEADIKTVQDLIAARKAELQGLQNEAANTKDDARRDYLVKVAIPAKQNEILTLEQKLQILIKQRDRIIADRTATQNKLTEILAQLGQLPAVQSEIKAEQKADIKAEVKGEVKATP